MAIIKCIHSTIRLLSAETAWHRYKLFCKGLVNSFSYTDSVLHTEYYICV